MQILAFIFGRCCDAAHVMKVQWADALSSDSGMRKLSSELCIGNGVDIWNMQNIIANLSSLAVRQCSWESLIIGHVQAGEPRVGEFAKVISTCEKMERQGFTPDLVSFVSILNACSHAGLVEGGEWYGITPNAEHHTCMINLLDSAGQSDRAFAWISKTPSHLNTVAWLTLLVACRKWGNVGLGHLAFERAVQLDEE